MSETGTYILNEYFILKLIFSYLPSRDLLNAAKVCRNWNLIALRALEENGEPQTCSVCVGGKIQNGSPVIENEIAPPLNDKQLPTIILNLASNSPNFGSSSLNKKLLDKLHDVYHLEDSSIYFIYADVHIFSWKPQEQYIIGMLKQKLPKSVPSHSLMLLSNMPGVKIECFQEYQKRIVKGRDGTLASLESISKSKGVLLIVGSRLTSANQAQLLLDELINICKSDSTTKSDMILAGGITRNVRRIQGTVQRTEILGITFSGENVEVHGAIHIPHEITLEEFMRNFSKKVGAVPNGCVRLAFSFICTNRKDTYSDVSVFKEFFPGVPIYGFYSWGEYFLSDIKGSSNSQQKNSKSNLLSENCFYTDSTSFLIVTLRKTKSTTS